MSSSSSTTTRILRLTSENAAAATEIMIEAFTHDPTYSWSRALGGRPVETMEYLMRSIVPAWAMEPFPSSFVATDHTGRVQGCILLEDFVHDASANGNGNQTPAPIVNILKAGEAHFWDALEASHRFPNRNVKGKYMYLAWLGVDPQAGGHGIGGQLVERAKQEARNGGFDWAVALCTSPGSTKLLRRQGFNCVGVVTYATFRVGDTYPFSSIPDEMSTMVWKVL